MVNSWGEWWLIIFVIFQLIKRKEGVAVFICYFAQSIVNIQRITVQHRHCLDKVAVDK